MRSEIGLLPLSKVEEENEQLQRLLMDTKYKLALEENAELRRSLKEHQEMLRETQEALETIQGIVREGNSRRKSSKDQQRRSSSKSLQQQSSRRLQRRSSSSPRPSSSSISVSNVMSRRALRLWKPPRALREGVPHATLDDKQVHPPGIIFLLVLWKQTTLRPRVLRE